MKDSPIEWTDHTFNPWIGCTKVSDGCKNCYAEAINSRFKGGNWGKGAPRRRTRKANWDQVRRWNREAERGVICECGFRENWFGTTLPCPKCKREGVIKRYRPRVFCASMADWLDDEVPIEWLADLLQIIHETPNLDWLLLTKRPENWYRRVSLVEGELAESWIDCIDMPDRGDIPPNVWVGTTIENRDQEQRIADLLKIPARVRFLSMEPLLGPVDLTEIKQTVSPGFFGDCLRWYHRGHCHLMDGIDYPTINWVICGGESGPNARPMHPDWARSLRDQCAAAGVPFFFKQWGEWGLDAPLKNGKFDFFAGKTMANDGTLYDASDLAFPNGKRYGEAIRKNHGQASLTRVYRVGKKAAGRLLDGVEHSGFPKTHTKEVD